MFPNGTKSDLVGVEISVLCMNQPQQEPLNVALMSGILDINHNLFELREPCLDKQIDSRRKDFISKCAPPLRLFYSFDARAFDGSRNQDCMTGIVSIRNDCIFARIFNSSALINFDVDGAK